MSAPAVIDSLEFARSAQQLSGSVAIADLKRLDDLLFDSEGAVSYELIGGRDERRRPQLHIRISGQLHLQCQRCLGLIDYALDIANTLLLLAQGEEVPDDLNDPESPDVIEASAELDIVALIEDEVLLGLPLAPRHPEGQCESRFSGREVENAATGSAFAKLAALKRTKH